MNARKMRHGSAMLLAAVGYLAALVVPAAAAAADPAAAIFDPARMYVIRLTLSPASEAKLDTAPFDYVDGTFSIAETDGTPEGVGPFTAPVTVGVRLKGDASFRSLNGKAAFKIRFGEANRLRGDLRLLTLNNMVEDPSMIHETLAYTAYRAAGVPASRTGYAYVYVNGEDFGVHLDIEALDEVALGKLFGSFDPGSQHLYEGENADDVRPGGAGGFELDEGDADRGDLEALIAAVNSNGPPDWSTRVAPVADLEEMTRLWATEKYVGQWDGYAGQEESWTPNNYYLFSSPTGRFQMLPWGSDETWQMSHRLAFEGAAGEMFDRCLDDEACLAIYRKSVLAVYETLTGMDLDALAAHTAAMLAPWQEMEDAGDRDEWDIEEIEAKVAETRQFIASRPAEAAAWLGDLGSAALPTAPVPPTSPTSKSTEPQSPGAGSSPARDLELQRIRWRGGVLRTRVHVGTGGVVTQRVKVPAGKRPAVICRDRVRVRRSRDLTLRCRLPVSARERLRVRSLRVTVTISLRGAGQAPETVIRRITLPRTRA